MNDTLSRSIRARYQQTLALIAEAAIASGRAPAAVRLVVVSKSQSLEVIQAAIAAGVTVFGENYAEEAVEKITALQQSAVEWHMIGHVQSRKAALIAGNFTMLHSLDGSKLAGRLDRLCGELSLTLPVLLEFNVSGEESKFGLPAWQEERWSDLQPEIEQTRNRVIAATTGKVVRGRHVMCIFQVSLDFSSNRIVETGISGPRPTDGLESEYNRSAVYAPPKYRVSRRLCITYACLS